MTIEEILGVPWGSCLRLAIEAASAGSLAISSVITNVSGEVISSGRNQLFDDRQSINPIRNTLVSHAELNAIAGLPFEYRADKRIVLYATVEPCPMCMGAIVMSCVRTIRIATTDPWAGAVGLLGKDRYMEHKHILVAYEQGLIRDLFFYINMISQRRRAPCPHPFYNSMEKAYPEQFPRIEKLENDFEFAKAFEDGDAFTVLKKVMDLDASMKTV